MPAERHLTIGQLAKAAGVPTSTVRYYERIGLLEPEDRSMGNYRLYRDESLRRLRFIRAAQAIGFALEDVTVLLGTTDRSSPSCRDVQSLIKQRLADVGKRLTDLRHVQRVLNSAMARCKQRERAGCCHVIEALRSRS